MNNEIIVQERHERTPGCICDGVHMHTSWCTAAMQSSIEIKDWIGESLCGKLPFHEASIEQQRAICAECPVLRQCLDFALQTHPSTDCVWAGATAKELAGIRMFGAQRKNRHLQELAKLAGREEIAS